MFPGQAGHVDSLGDVDGLRELVDVLERALDAVEDGAQDTGTKFHGEGLAGTQYGVADCHARGLFVYLVGRIGNFVACLFCVAAIATLVSEFMSR